MLRILVTVSDWRASSTSRDGDDGMSGCSERLTSCGSEKDIPLEAERRGCFFRQPLSRVTAGSGCVTGVGGGATDAIESTEWFRCSLLSLRGRKGDRLSCRFRIPDLRSGTSSVERRGAVALSSFDLRRRLKNPRDPDVASGAWFDDSSLRAEEDKDCIGFSAIFRQHSDDDVQVTSHMTHSFIILSSFFHSIRFWILSKSK